MERIVDLLPYQHKVIEWSESSIFYLTNIKSLSGANRLFFTLPTLSLRVERIAHRLTNDRSGVDQIALRFTNMESSEANLIITAFSSGSNRPSSASRPRRSSQWSESSHIAVLPEFSNRRESSIARQLDARGAIRLDSILDRQLADSANGSVNIRTSGAYNHERRITISDICQSVRPPSAGPYRNELTRQASLIVPTLRTCPW